MSIRVTHTLDDFERDQRELVTRSRRDMRAVVRDGLRAGNAVAKDNAKRSAGRHGKHYHRAFSWEMHTSLFGAGAATISGEYGPDIAKPQGDMSFERGSRNQPPHLDLARSADLIGASYAQEARALPDRWFWT